MNQRQKRPEKKTIQSFIDHLVHPPALTNPLRRSASAKKISNAQPTAEPSPELHTLPSPMKKRSRSQDKSSSIFMSSKTYNDPFSSQNSVSVTKLSQLQEMPLINIPEKGVRFRESIISKNEHNRRQSIPLQCRTPSILKRSRVLRQQTIQRLQSNLTGSHLTFSQKSTPLIQQDKQTRALRTNQVVRKRYNTILQRYRTRLGQKVRAGLHIRSDEKYKDELFPPILSSIYRGGMVKNSQLKHETIRWIRLPELFRDRKLCIYNQAPSNIEIYCNQWKQCNNFIGDAFTAIKDCKPLLGKIFQGQNINIFGAYLVKIFQENVWKYVIVDDLIPTIRDDHGNQVPLYCNICEVAHSQQPLELWPFLLEKAYASYYANYESLHFGSTIDFLEEVTGTSSEQFRYTANLKKMNVVMRRLGDYLQRQNIIFLGYIDQMQVYMPIHKNTKGRIVAKRSYENQPEEVVINIDNIFDYFDLVYVISPLKWEHSAVSSVGLNIKRSPHEVPRFDISLRILKVTKNGHISISVRQKEKRFYQSSSLNYKYIWNRVMIFQKQFDGGCRWITGKYSSNKTINFTDYFEAGQYYLIFLPEWKLSHCYQLSFLALSTVPISITRKEYDDKERLFQKGCADLAQRKGKLQQISLYACSYCLVEEEAGLMIENINNERPNGDIRINRSIGNIRNLSAVIPFNLQFYLNKTNTKVPFKTNISIFIPNDKEFTVVLMTHGGIDKNLLKRFDFTQ